MKKLENTTKQTYNKVSENWNTKRTISWEPVTKFLTKQKNKPKLKLIDLGSGTGRDLETAIKLGYTKKNCIGLDYAKNQLKILKEKGFKTKLANLTKLPFKNEQYDIILSIASFHHLLTKQTQTQAINEIKRITKKGGKILLTNWFPNKETLKNERNKGKLQFLTKQIAKVNYTHNEQKHERYYYFFTKKELEELIKNSKLKIISKKLYKQNYYLELRK